MNTLWSTLLVCLGLLVPPHGPVAGPPGIDDELDAAVRQLREAGAKGTPGDRQAALEQLIALASVDAVVAVQAEFSRTGARRRGAERELVEHGFRLERQRALLAVMHVRLERDPGLKESVERIEKGIEELETKLELARSTVTEAGAWSDALGGAVFDLVDGLGTGARKKALGALWDDAEEHPDYGVRLGAIEMLGRVATKGTALDIYRILAKAESARHRLKKSLPKLEAKVREFEARLQRENEQTGGATYRGTNQEYDRVRRDAAVLRRELTTISQFVDAAAAAAGRALLQEQGDELDKAVATLARASRKAKGGLGLKTFRIFEHAKSDAVAERLRTMLADADEPLLLGSILDALAVQGDTLAVEGILPLLDHEAWHVKSRAAAALAELRSRDAVPALIDALADVEGRTKTDFDRALASLTGKRFHGRPELWQHWWKAEGESFVVPDVAEADAGESDPADVVGVTFFGIRTESQRVLFILDVSRSMNFSMVPRDNPNDRQGIPNDMPQAGEDSRLVVAKRQLVKALGGIRDGGAFNLVLYASDVWTWSDSLEDMDADAREEALRYLEDLEANGGTNIYGALATAFDLAGVDRGDKWNKPEVDTIFLLSDGRASIGVTTEPEEILTYVRERNASAGITLHTIGLSGAQDAYLLRSLAEQNGGTYAAR